MKAGRRIVSVVLAAGRGERLGGPKALLAWPGPKGVRPLAIAHAEERLAAESAHVLVVTRRAVMNLLLGHVRPGIDLLASDAPDEQEAAGSIAFAVTRLAPNDAEIVLLTPVDTPPAQRETVAKLVARLEADPALAAVRPAYGGRAGHPVVVRPGALERYRVPVPPPPPLRDFFRDLGPAAATADVADANVLIDLDRPADVMGVLGSLPRFLSA